MFNIEKVEVRTNQDGLYCLNDLHKASGGDKRNTPTYWLENSKTKDIIDHLETTGNPVVDVSTGRYGGTFVSMELVYSYAMWISPKFHVEVVQAFHEINKAESTLDNLVSNVREHGKNFSELMNKSAGDMAEIKQHGSSWGSYGHQIRKAKKEMAKELKRIKNEVQVQMDLIGGE